MDRPRAYAALAFICIVWGSTYIAIRIALETTPPLLIVTLRYGVSGAILLIAALVQRKDLPRGRELVIACISGIMILAIGNGAIVLSELVLPSGTTALILSVFPFWLIIMESRLPGGERLTVPIGIGMSTAFAGSLLLASGVGTGLVKGGIWKGFAVLQVGMCCWSFASVYQRRYLKTGGPLVASSIQQLSGSVACLPIALIGLPDWHPHRASILAIAYLTVFASLIGYSCYVYALKQLPTATVALYPYVNALVALGLGVAVYREPFGMRSLTGMLFVAIGVAITLHARGRAVKR